MKSIEQAKKIYELCVSAAKMSKTLTYSEVLDHLGYIPRATGNVIRYGLELTWIACADKKLPILTSIVVNKTDGRPSKGYPIERWEKDVQRVFNFQMWPPVDEIDWNYIWDNRKKLSDKYATTGYWNNR